MTRRRPLLDTFLGILLVIVCDIAYVVTAFFTIGSGVLDDLLLQWYPNDGYRQLMAMIVAISGTGLIQFLYVGPLIWLFLRRRRPDFAKGLAIGAGFVLLLNVGCFVAMF